MNLYNTLMDIKKDSHSGTLYVAKNKRGNMVEYFGDVPCENCGALCRSVSDTPWVSVPGMSIAEMVSVADREIGRYDLPELSFDDDGEECCTDCEGR